MTFHYVWLVWSSAFLVPWILLYASYPRHRLAMWQTSGFMALFGLTEPLFVPAYWNPPSLFELARRTGFDIESFIFAFALGGIGAVLYNGLTGTEMTPLGRHERSHPRHRMHRAALLTTFVAFPLLYALPWNVIYASIAAMLAGTIAGFLCRPDLFRKTWVGGLLFLVFYTVFLLGLKWSAPGYIERVWNLPALSGVLVFGLPVEELLFGLTFGLYWAAVYEHFAWLRVADPGAEARIEDTAMKDPHEAHRHHAEKPEPTHDHHSTPAAEAKGPAGHDHAAMMSDPGHAKAMEADMRRRFWVALAFTIPVTVIAGHIPGLPMLVEPPLSSWLGLALSTPVVWWSGWVFIAGSFYALKKGRLDMSVLIATGVLAAYLSSIYLTVISYPTAYYEAAAMLVTFVLFGHWMEMKSRRGTSDALRALFDLVPPTARVLRGDTEVTLPTSEVVVGDLLRLRPGDKIPVDGELTIGETDVDESLVTGESVPVKKHIGQGVVGGSINVSGAVTMRATKVGSDTVLAQVAALVAQAQNSKAPRQRLADRAAAVLVVVAVGAGILTFIGWRVFADAPFVTALTFAISAVVIACPDALGLATPTAVAVGTGLGARHNILIKDAATLEGVSRIQTVVLDKTGTLTEGKPSVTEIKPVAGVTADALLAAAAAPAGQSTHPLSLAIAQAAASRKLSDQAAATEVTNVPGMGLRAVLNGQVVLTGNAALFQQEGVDLTPVRAMGAALADAGRSLTYVALGGRAIGVLGITDAIRPTSAAAITELKAMGITPVLLSGDLRQTAERVAREVGIEKVFAEVKPEEKAAYVKQLQDAGQFTAMVGDGVNDAPALAQADIGIAIGAGTDVAIQAAQVVLMRSDPGDISRAVRLSRATVRKMKQNLAWASVYNLLAIPVAAGVFYNSLGWSLRPEVSALLMSASSIIVAVNAVSLRNARL